MTKAKQTSEAITYSTHSTELSDRVFSPQPESTQDSAIVSLFDDLVPHPAAQNCAHKKLETLGYHMPHSPNLYLEDLWKISFPRK